MGDDLGQPLFCAMSKDGTWSRPHQVRECGFVVERPGDRMWEPEHAPCLLDATGQTFVGEIDLDADAVSELIGEGHQPSGGDAFALAYGATAEVWCHRHRHVWQYRRERKGNRHNRRVRGHWEKVRRTVLVPRATCRYELCPPKPSDGAEPQPVSVRFETDTIFLSSESERRLT